MRAPSLTEMILPEMQPICPAYAGLERWIADIHLSEASVAAARRSLASKANAAVMDGVLMPEKLAVLRRLFSDDGAFKTTHGLLDRHPHDVSAEEFATAPPECRFYRYRVLSGPAAGGGLRSGYAGFLMFQCLTTSPGWLAWLGDILGAPVSARTGMHARIMTDGMFMNLHNDTDHGDLCAVFYLNDSWSPAFGGTFIQKSRGHVVSEAEPLANRLLLFRPCKGYLHGVAPFGKEVGSWERWSFSLWFGNAATWTDPH